MEDRNVLERILAGSEEPRDLSLSLLESITENFSQKIAQGGFAEVFKGVLPNGSVAVKRIVLTSHTIDDTLFKREVQSLLKLKISHQNIVRFLGFCSNARHVTEGSENVFIQKRERLLCFEYISSGSLDKHITDELHGLEWSTRYRIIKGLCEGLRYLHDEMHIKHMDLKPANIMLDDNMVPKITDFGLSRTDEKSHTTSECFLSRPYCAPEYYENRKISFQCDIYSLAVTIVELVTGSTGIPQKNNVLRKWKCRWNELMSYKSPQAQQVTKCIEIAERCRKKKPGDRPCISRVIQDLNEIGNMDGRISAADKTKSLPWEDDDMLWIKPVELHFAIGPNKQISCLVELANMTGSCVAFNIKTPSKLQYCAEPKKGIVPPGSKRTVKITLQAPEMTPRDNRPVNEFIVKSMKVKEGLKDDDITKHMFKNEVDKVVDEVNLTVVYDETEKQQVDLSLELPAEATNVPVSKDDMGSSSYQRTTRLNFKPPQRTTSIIDEAYSKVVMRYPRRESAQAVDLMTGAMGSLLPKLGELLKPGQNLQMNVRQDVESLERQLKSMHAALCSVSEKQQQEQQLDAQDKHWANEVRELSYDIEDAVDDLLVGVKGTEPITNWDGFGFGFGGLIHKMINLIKNWAKTRYHIAPAIKDIKVRVREVADIMRDRNKVGSFVVNNNAARTNTSSDPRLFALYDRKELVGIDGTQDDLANRLTGWDDGLSKRLKIISIFGPGGLGKTTLAKAVYDRLQVEFTLKAFVSVGRNPDMKEILEDILLELDKKMYADIHNRKWKIKNLIDELQDILKYKRYLIIIDDIWDITSWEIIKRALIHNDQRSRIITTSRIFEVAENSGEVCELEPLSDNHSKELFYAILSGGKGISTFDQPDGQSTKILQKCGGVPLAIITIASLLADKPRKEWPKVYNSIGFGNEDNGVGVVMNTRKILLFSYYDLPCYLKTCLLYLSIFPEDRTIEKDTLIWKWVAEDFVHEEPEESLFKVGERYFNVLINRCMIQPVADQSGYNIYACRVHDMVLDMICSVAKEENFVTILGRDDQNLSAESETNARRLAVHNRVMEQHEQANTSTCKPKVRSFNATMCHFSMMPSLLSFKVLRVLSLEYCSTGEQGEEDQGSSNAAAVVDDDDKEEECSREKDMMKVHSTDKINIAGLLHLRYLGLRQTCIRELPTEIGNLRFLQTLDLRQTEVKALPQSLIQLRELKCLRCGPSVSRLPDGMGNLTSLEDLRLYKRLFNVIKLENFVKELGKLIKLRVLHMDASGFSDSLNKALVESLSNLDKIENLEIEHDDALALMFFSMDELKHDGEPKEPSWGSFSPSQLRNLRLHNAHVYSRGLLPAWLDASPLPNLASLDICVKSVEARDLNILGSFPKLRFLSLFVFNLHKVYRHAIAADAFPKLRSYRTNILLTHLSGAMPCLESVDVCVDLEALKTDANIGLEFDSWKYLPWLQKVTVCISRFDVIIMKEMEELVRAAARHAVNIHRNRPILDVRKFGPFTVQDFGNSSFDSEQADVTYQKLQYLPTMVEAVLSNDPNEQLDAAMQFRKLLSKRNPPIEEVISTGVVPRFIEFLSYEDHPQLQLVAARVLATIIASGTSENIKAVVESGAVPNFIKLLNSHSEDVHEEVIWVLGKVSLDSPKWRDLVLGHGGLFPLLQHLNEHAKLSMLRIATWTLGSFCYGKPQPNFDQVKPVLTALQRLIHSQDEEVLTNACQALACLSSGTNNRIQAVIESGMLPRIMELLMHSSTKVLIAALCTVHNIVAGDGLQIQSVIDHHALQCLLNLLTTNHKESIIKKEACRIISIITAHNSEQIQAVVNANIIAPLVHLLHTAEFEIKHEAARAISNATSGGTHDQIKYLVAQGCIKPLCDLLICLDSEVVLVCLNGLENILKVGEVEKNLGAGDINAYAQMIDDAKGLDKIENLWNHKNNWICEKAGKILESYWLELVQLNLLPAMVQSVLSNDPNMQLDATTQFKKLLSIERSHLIEEAEEAISTVVVPHFIEFLTREDNHQLQVEAASALRIFVLGTSERTKVVVESGAVPIFVQLLSSHSEDVCEQAVWVLGKVAFDSPDWRDLVLGHGGLFPLLQQLNNEHAKLSMLRIATWTLGAFFHGKPQPILDQVKPALPALQHLIHSEDVVVLVNACRALACLCSENNDKMQAVIESGVLPRLVELLVHPFARVLDPVMCTVCNIMAAGDDLETQSVIDHQGLPRLLELLTSSHEKSIKIGACWAISKITAGNREQIQAVINANIIAPLVHLLQTAEFDTRTFAARAISNATSGGTHDQIKYLIVQGCIKPLCDMLVCPDPSTVAVCLKGLGNILKVGEADKNLEAGDHNVYAQMIDGAEGRDKIENLRSHYNTEIHLKAVKMLESYWLEEEDNAMLSGDNPHSGFNFRNNSSGSEQVDISDQEKKGVSASTSLSIGPKAPATTSSAAAPNPDRT